MAFKRQVTFESTDDLLAVAEKMNKTLADIERAFAVIGLQGAKAAVSTVTTGGPSGAANTNRVAGKISVEGGGLVVRSLDGALLVEGVPEIVIDTASALDMTALANGAILLSATGGGGGGTGGPYFDYIVHGEGLADIVGETISLGVTVPVTDYVVFIRGYKSDGTPVGGIKVTKTTTDFTVYPPEDVVYFDYGAFRIGDYCAIIVDADPAGEDFTLTPNLSGTNYMVLYRAYVTSDGTPVEGVKITKAVDKVTVLPPESGVTIELVVRA